MMGEANIQQSAKDLEKRDPYPTCMNSQDRAFLSDNGGLAMFITPAMVRAFNHIRESKESIAKGTKAVEAAERRIRSIECDIYRAERKLDHCQTREEEHHTCVGLAELREDLGQAGQRVEELKKRMEADESHLRHAREELEGCFGKVLQAEGLLKVVKANKRSVNEQDEAPAGDMGAFGYAWPPQYEERLPPHLEELAMQTAQENLDRSLGNLLDVQFRFNERHEHYMQGLAEYQLLLEMGEIDYTFTEFGLRDIERVQHLTQELKIAEENYKATKMHAENLELPQFDPHHSSDFVDRDDDGFRESEQAEAVTGIDRSRIERWQYGVVYAQMTNRASPKSAELTEIDEWDARTVGIDDSVSAVDCDRYCNKIDLWVKHCSDLRQELASEAQAEDLWVPDARLLGERRRSC